MARGRRKGRSRLDSTMAGILAGAGNLESMTRSSQSSPRASPKPNREGAPANPSSEKEIVATREDQEEGAALKFVPLHEFNGQHCAKIERIDVAEEVEYWSNAVICGVIGSNPPLDVGKSIDNVLQVRKGVFLVRFHDPQDKLTVMKNGIYFFDKKPFIMKAWNKERSLDISSLPTFPVWVQFPKLEIKYWGWKA
ncbi:hypothetical protein Cgig2_004287 [Carnegiea gigantea]|uniref:DUF4283 domain-containing protein n=1 Tax=Carnegiea gigantea TaxID=171969 RepID=A0A9Q1GUZ2_9CARY|nr:hypothetical protein Cgig2_004287 [Carnegiea gigantea]